MENGFNFNWNCNLADYFDVSKRWKVLFQSFGSGGMVWRFIFYFGFFCHYNHTNDSVGQKKLNPVNRKVLAWILFALLACYLVWRYTAQAPQNHPSSRLSGQHHNGLSRFLTSQTPCARPPEDARRSREDQAKTAPPHPASCQSGRQEQLKETARNF